MEQGVSTGDLEFAKLLGQFDAFAQLDEWHTSSVKPSSAEGSTKDSPWSDAMGRIWWGQTAASFFPAELFEVCKAATSSFESGQAIQEGEKQGKLQDSFSDTLDKDIPVTNPALLPQGEASPRTSTEVSPEAGFLCPRGAYNNRPVSQPGVGCINLTSNNQTGYQVRQFDAEDGAEACKPPSGNEFQTAPEGPVRIQTMDHGAARHSLGGATITASATKVTLQSTAVLCISGCNPGAQKGARWKLSATG